ncbi:unnamed protein product [Tilletia caries]|uniref:Uncharacterized protein n=3 Tax=Tilletia TaxID=13289 RepID=A0A8T8SQS6_9BASI|nr:hypothetical protein CF336_g7993 [Tilletia laevis]KAE8186049.1 hypothetical protein CF335_g7556 [Tilletia laevis]KAE8244474.1 hypothetical protein A4X03_0g7526 [Tilletia caries]CAD6958236.1 unnamed protein product [Tilletia caries]
MSSTKSRQIKRKAARKERRAARGAPIPSPEPDPMKLPDANTFKRLRGRARQRRKKRFQSGVISHRRRMVVAKIRCLWNIARASVFRPKKNQHRSLPAEDAPRKRSRFIADEAEESGEEGTTERPEADYETDANKEGNLRNFVTKDRSRRGKRPMTSIYMQSMRAPPGVGLSGMERYLRIPTHEETVAQALSAFTVSHPPQT